MSRFDHFLTTHYAQWDLRKNNKKLQYPSFKESGLVLPLWQDQQHMHGFLYSPAVEGAPRQNR